VWSATPINIADVAGVLACHSENSPPLSETKTSNVATPEPPASSAPVQLTMNQGKLLAGSELILLAKR
jgi:hypothetical protein